MGAGSNGGTRAASKAAEEQAAREQAQAEALAQAAEQAAQAQAQAEADEAARVAAEQADEAARVAAEQADEGAPTRPSLREKAQAQTAQAVKASAPLVLADGCEWHIQPGIGKHGVTVETDVSGTKSRYFVTWVPQIGRVHKVPTLDSFYELMDAGDLN